MKKSFAAVLALAVALTIASPAFARTHKHHKKHHKHHAARMHKSAPAETPAH